MNIRHDLTALALAGLALCSSAAAGDPERSFTIRVDTPPLVAIPQEDGLAELRIAKFGTHTAVTGAPDVPSRTVLVAIPPGTSPRLELRSTGARGFRDLLPRPLPRRTVDAGLVDREGVVRRADRQPTGFADRYFRNRYEPLAEHYEGQGSFPQRAAWLGKGGTLRDQQYVELHLAPVRYDRALAGLIVDSEIEATVHFDGEYELAAEPAADTHFESIYRGAFANYEQGRLFRVIEPDPELPLVPAAASGAGVGPQYRLLIESDGPVRLDHTLLSAEAADLLATDPRNWRLMNRGEQIALQLNQSAGDDSLFEPGEWIQFYGQALDDEPETSLNHEQAGQEIANLYAVEDFSDRNVYFLTAQAGAQPQMASDDATPAGGGSPASFFIETARAESDDFYFPMQDSLWSWLPFTSQSTGPRSEAIALPGLASATEPLQMRVGVRGFLDCPSVAPDKKTSVRLRNSLAQTLDLPAANPDNSGNLNIGEFDGNTVFVHDFAWSHEPGDPEATDPLDVVLDAESIPGSCPDGGVLNENLLDFIEIDYSRSFVAVGDRLEFSYPDGDTLFEITEFTTSAIDVYEITGTLGAASVTDASRLTGVEITPDGTGGFKARFEIEDQASGQDRRFVAAAAAGVNLLSAADLEADRTSTLASDPSSADMVVIAHPELIEGVCSMGFNSCDYDVDCTGGAGDRCEIPTGSSLDLLLAHRATQGISSRVVRLQDLYDEFNFGLEGPGAIRNFAAWLLAGGWDGGSGQDAPAWMMLIGDGTFDYKGGTAAGNYVPTQIMVKHGGESSASVLPYYSSDNQLVAATGGDQLADMTVGRIPARTLTEADDMLDRIRLHETSPGAGPWNERVLFISDRGANDDFLGSEAAGFTTMNLNAANYLDDTNYTAVHLEYWFDNCLEVLGNCDPGQMLDDILLELNALDRGAAIVQFTGHGNFDLWSNDVFFCANDSFPHPNCAVNDTTLLSNFNRLPMLIVHNCLTGGFHGSALKQFGEQWLKQTSGGAFAVLAPSGLGFQFIGNAFIDVWWPDVFGPEKERVVGVSAMTGHVQLCTQGSIEPCQFYTLLGDPASRLGLPHVDAVDNLVATASTGVDPEVELTWDASETAGVTYDIYRQRVVQENSYTKIASSPTAGYTDDTVEHTRTYLYYVVARAGGFDSAWSNFNTDCGETPGPDCVQATPLNLVPPATPVGVTAIDSETGGALTVGWAFNPEEDIQRYVIHFGPTAALGQTVEVFDSVNQKKITGLVDGTPYHVSVQARNSSGTESLLSNPQVIATPNLVLGVKSPQFVDDLMIGKSGSDAVLSWGAVTTDIYDKPIAVGSYEVFRGTDAQFVPEPANRIAVVGAPGYTDPGALAGGTPYHYLVRAVDAAGNGGGLGRQLPDGILDLRLQHSDATPGNVFLSWTPVTTDFDGLSTTISHYEIWSWSSPFTRADIEAETVQLLVPNASGPLAEITPVAGSRYYSVLAVDHRGNRSPF